MYGAVKQQLTPPLVSAAWRTPGKWQRSRGRHAKQSAVCAREGCPPGYLGLARGHPAVQCMCGTAACAADACGRRFPHPLLPLSRPLCLLLSRSLPTPAAVAMAELARLQNDPNYVFEFALGPPSATLVDQTGAPPELNLNIQNRVSSEVTRYVMKSAHLSLDDLRMFDVSTGKLAMVSHHPGKNPVCWSYPRVLGCGVRSGVSCLRWPACAPSCLGR